MYQNTHHKWILTNLSLQITINNPKNEVAGTYTLKLYSF